MSNSANYSATKAVVDGVDIVRLSDAGHGTDVSIAVSVGNLAYEMKVNGKNAFWMPFSSVGDLKSNPAMCGNPFLEPWANRIDHETYYLNGRKYLLNPNLKNYRYDANRKPIHGLLTFSSYWEVAALEADSGSARVTSRLEFWKHPNLMAQFPLAHTVEMTYRLQDGVLEVETALRNHSTESMPVSVGYHPYFHLHDAPRKDWRVHLAARERMMLSKVLIPTGELTPVPYADPQPLAGIQLDDVFTSLVLTDGKARFWVQGKNEKISVLYGPKYPVAVVFAPKGKNFICFEPMSAITNAFNLAQAGVFKDLQTIPPGGEWRESFWIAPSGF